MKTQIEYRNTTTTASSGTGQSVLGCSLTSCTPQTLGAGCTSIRTIVIDLTAIYWTDDGSQNTANGAIWKLAK